MNPYFEKIFNEKSATMQSLSNANSIEEIENLKVEFETQIDKAKEVFEKHSTIDKYNNWRDRVFQEFNDKYVQMEAKLNVTPIVEFTNGKILKLELPNGFHPKREYSVKFTHETLALNIQSLQDLVPKIKELEPTYVDTYMSYYLKSLLDYIKEENCNTTADKHNMWVMKNFNVFGPNGWKIKRMCGVEAPIIPEPEPEIKRDYVFYDWDNYDRDLEAEKKWFIENLLDEAIGNGYEEYELDYQYTKHLNNQGWNKLCGNPVINFKNEIRKLFYNYKHGIL